MVVKNEGHGNSSLHVSQVDVEVVRSRGLKGEEWDAAAEVTTNWVAVGVMIDATCLHEREYIFSNL